MCNRDDVVVCDISCSRGGRKLVTHGCRSNLQLTNWCKLITMQLFQRYVGLIHICENWQVFLNKILGTCNISWWSLAKHLPTLHYCHWFFDLFTILLLLFRENCMISGSQIHEILPSSGKNNRKTLKTRKIQNEWSFTLIRTEEISHLSWNVSLMQANIRNKRIWFD